MEYEFGDILDARQSPEKHFIVVVGEISKKNKVTKQETVEVMYYLITSRVYAVFKDILVFFNDCLKRKDSNFLRYFNKEKDKKVITAHGLLSQAVFLDKVTNYNACLDLESMVVVNNDPKLIDKAALETLRGDGKVLVKSKLVKLDALNLKQVILYSNDVSPDKQSRIAASFNKIKKSLI